MSALGVDEMEVEDFAEIEAAADTIKAIWESDDCQRAVRETGFGASYFYLARAALEAAGLVRGRHVPQANRCLLH